MAATRIDLTDAAGMDPARLTGHDGRWYLRQRYDYNYHVGLLSERAPAGTRACDLRPGAVEISCDDEDGIELDAAQLIAFLRWPPAVERDDTAGTGLIGGGR